MVQSSLNKLKISNMGPIAFLRGVVACGSENLLLSGLQLNVTDDLSSCLGDNCDKLDGVKPLILQLWQYIYSLCQGDLTIHYHAFQILSLWLTRLTKVASNLKSGKLVDQCSSKIKSEKSVTQCSLVVESEMLVNFCTSVVKSIWELVMLNWDSPVEDVPEIIVEIFSKVLTVWELMTSGISDFVDDVLKVILESPWFVKGKYRVFALLLKYVNTEKVLNTSDY